MSTSSGARTAVVAGATSASGVALTHALLADGYTVVAVGSSAERLERALAGLDGVDRRVCDLTDEAAVSSLAARLQADHGGVDALFHLVGGWRGGTGITTQTTEDYDALHRSVFTTLFNTSRAFYDQLAARGGRLAAVSATAVATPTAPNASYAAVKASVDAWLQAVADGFSKDGTAAAATAVVVKALLDDRMRAEHPERTFPGYTHVADLARILVSLPGRPPAEINGARIDAVRG
ncbi:SDR family NAD(P)-dependent oxidoreductase [Arthrobacter agilis]|uniref:SDR family NAD(P)-dependent oxidoreductase n=1 Tax=Arthrobacter agilis TaxID=37921 RepID=UPI0023673F5C|nr:SDR family oxidoreductase [Arthrobacter agilis]WDF31955.1 SDR family NAD(P)-dependent oxidoreductase [Arthrobacter agilis]